MTAAARTQLRDRYARLLDRLCAAAMALACVMLVILVAVVFTQVVLGWMGRTTPLWLAQCTHMAVVSFVFLSIGPGLRENTHLAVEALVSRLPRSWQRWIDIATTLAVLGVLVLIAWAAVGVIGRDWSIRMPETRWPRSLNNLLVPPGAALAAMVSLERLWHLWTRSPDIAPPDITPMDTASPTKPMTQG